MARKTTGKRLELLHFFYGTILYSESFNSTTQQLKIQLNRNLTEFFLSKTQKERTMFLTINNNNSRNSIQKQSFLYLFNEGSETINNFFLKARSEFLNENNTDVLNNPLLSDELMYQTTTDLLYIFSTQQPWYLTYLYKKPISINLREEDISIFESLNQRLLEEDFDLSTQPNTYYVNITTEVHKKLTQSFYSPAVLIKKVIEQAFSPKELSEFRKDNSKVYELINKIDEDLLNALRTFLGCTVNEIPPLFFSNVKNIGLKLLIKNFDYTVPISSLTTLGMSEIFKSLPLNKKIIKFLHKHGASLSVIELYEKLQNNPVLFFDLKKQAAQINHQTLLKLESFIEVYNSAFLPEIINSKATFTPEETKLLKKQNAFLYYMLINRI